MNPYDDVGYMTDCTFRRLKLVYNLVLSWDVQVRHPVHRGVGEPTMIRLLEDHSP